MSPMGAGNDGVLDGIGSDDWATFRPRLDCWNTGLGGAATPPILGQGTGAKSAGRFLYLPKQRLCKYRFNLQFGGTGFAPGGGGQNSLNGSYLVELPIPAMVIGGPDGADNQLGDGFILQGVTGVGQYPGIPCQFTNSDVPGATYGGSRGKWAQMFVQYATASGTVSIGAAATSQAVAFTVPLNVAPLAGEIVLMPTNLPTTPTPFAITAVSAAGFTVSCKSVPGTAWNFSWVLTSYRTTLVNAQSPFAGAVALGGTAGDSIRGLLEYETAY
jgi:hypothetical protein